MAPNISAALEHAIHAGPSPGPADRTRTCLRPASDAGELGLRGANLFEPSGELALVVDDSEAADPALGSRARIVLHQLRGDRAAHGGHGGLDALGVGSLEVGT